MACSHHPWREGLPLSGSEAETPLYRWQSLTAMMLKNPSSLSFRGAAGDEESRPDQIGVSRARFLAQLTLNRQGEIPRFARNDSEGLGMIVSAGFFSNLLEEVQACRVC